MSNTREKRNQHKRKALPYIITCVVCIVLVVSVVLIWTNWNHEENKTSSATVIEPTSTPRNLSIDPNAGELITPTPAPTLPGVSISGKGAIKLPAGTLEAPASLYNSIENDGWYYLTYELRLKDTEEVIFTTGLIPPGQYCNKVILNRELEKGEYPAYLFVQPYIMNESLTPTNNANLATTLIVE